MNTTTKFAMSRFKNAIRAVGMTAGNRRIAAASVVAAPTTIGLPVVAAIAGTYVLVHIATKAIDRLLD